jgi:hypothetical protein
MRDHGAEELGTGSFARGEPTGVSAVRARRSARTVTRVVAGSGLLVQALQRIEEAEPADEPLLGPALPAEPSRDRLAVEMDLEVDPEHAIRRLVAHAADPRRGPRSPRRGAPRSRFHTADGRS